MPGFKAHYLFGQKALSDLDPTVTIKPIETYPKSYNLGLQGPDFFYFCPQAWVAYDRNIGDIMHEENVKAFFASLMKERDHFRHSYDRAICDAYICGFMGHYSLDTAVHPYINYRTCHFKHKNKKGSYDFGVHVFLETDIDNDVCRHLANEKPSAVKGWRTVTLPPHERAVIGRLLYRAIKRTYPSHEIKKRHLAFAFHTAPIVQWLLHDPTGLKKILVRSIEDRFAGWAIVSSMIPNAKRVTYPDPCNTKHKTWKNPWDETITSKDSVYDLMDQASEALGERIAMYMAAFSDKPHDRRDDHANLLNALLTDLGDKSYSSGLSSKQTRESEAARQNR